MLLSDLENRQTGIIVRVNGRGAFRKRMAELGFIRGREIKVIKKAPLKDPIEYSVMGYNISLRRSEASLIEISHTNPGSVITSKNEPLEYDLKRKYPVSSAQEINIALIGNPNSGKTSIFNNSTHSTEHVGNYSGVTVETKLSRIEYNGYILNIFDLPGTYSLSSFSPEERFVRTFLVENSPDVVINVLDASNIERNLYLTTQLIDMNIRMVIALNMYDEFKNSGDKFNHKNFSTLLGMPVIPTVGSRGKGLARLYDAAIRKYEQREHNRKKIHINYGSDVEKSISKIREAIITSSPSSIIFKYCPRYAAIKLLEKDGVILDLFSSTPELRHIADLANRERESINNKFNDKTENVLTDYRYGFITGALKETYTFSENAPPDSSERIDRLLTHKYLGLPIFFGLLWLVFMTTFKLGSYPVEWIESGINGLSLFLEGLIPEGDLRHLLVDGIIGGVGGIIVFVPNILILFFFISFMEDTGYMARAAFIMDKLMHKIGLHGKSFIPLVMGFGCNVPAIMSTRIIESRNNRLLTILILPFMSCSARLPVYILIISAFFPVYQGTFLFGIYLTGILFAVISALIFKNLFFKREDTPFVMELPPYRIPTLKNTSRHMWMKTQQYIQKIGGVILLASIIIWGLNYYPQNSPLLSKQNPETTIAQTENQMESPLVTDSYLERIGKTLQPVMEPLGFDWKATVSLLAGVSAKEIIVSTMGVLYNSGEMGNQSLKERVKNEKYSQGPMKGSLVFSPAVAISFLMFTLLYFPCIAVLATVSKETGSIKWALLMMVYTTGLAWVMSFLSYRFAQLIF